MSKNIGYTNTYSSGCSRCLSVLKYSFTYVANVLRVRILLFLIFGKLRSLGPFSLNRIKEDKQVSVTKKKKKTQADINTNIFVLF